MMCAATRSAARCPGRTVYSTTTARAIRPTTWEPPQACSTVPATPTRSTPCRREPKPDSHYQLHAQHPAAEFLVCACHAPMYQPQPPASAPQAAVVPHRTHRPYRLPARHERLHRVSPLAAPRARLSASPTRHTHTPACASHAAPALSPPRTPRPCPAPHYPPLEASSCPAPGVRRAASRERAASITCVPRLDRLLILCTHALRSNPRPAAYREYNGHHRWRAQHTLRLSFHRRRVRFHPQHHTSGGV
ncbi:hypothetical protein B0H14DRAFT_1459385 [Mycena olivaceomarginata]|nr:hypothetical protein B0H14DRAFT_1459385 [Mycena olivaceomarginata]